MPDLYGDVVEDEAYSETDERSGISQRMRSSVLLSKLLGYTESEIALLPQRKIKQLLQAAQIEASKGGLGGCPIFRPA